VIRLASEIAGYTSYGLRNTKEVMWHNLDTPSQAAAIALENRNQLLGGATREVQEYMAKYSARVKKER
jgi:enoyl-CoA hydratase